jgi:hypothetical protein
MLFLADKRIMAHFGAKQGIICNPFHFVLDELVLRLIVWLDL